MTWKWIAPLVLFASLSGAMHADILNYTWTVQENGSLDGVAFEHYGFPGNTVTFSMIADSATVTTQAGTYPSYRITGPVTVSVAGVGTDAITDTVFVYEQTNQLIFGLNDTTTGSGFNILKDHCTFGCTPYDYLTGPLADNGSLAHSTLGGETFNTAHGSLVFDGYPYASGTPHFQITEANVASTPEPSSFILLGSGALGLLTMLRKRHRTKAESQLE